MAQVDALRVGWLVALCGLEVEAELGGRIRRGGAAGAALRNDPSTRAEWRERAKAIWDEEPGLSTRKVAERIDRAWREAVRKAIADLKPG